MLLCKGKTHGDLNSKQITIHLKNVKSGIHDLLPEKNTKIDYTISTCDA